MWINEFKVAIVEKNTQRIDELLEETPTFSEVKDMQEASYLMREAAELLYKLKDETGATMKQIKKNLDFLSATHSQTPVSLFDSKV